LSVPIDERQPANDSVPQFQKTTIDRKRARSNKSIDQQKRAISLKTTGSTKACQHQQNNQIIPARRVEKANRIESASCSFRNTHSAKACRHTEDIRWT